jgi:uncharacterized repeat protein (TIGR01451 family)
VNAALAIGFTLPSTAATGMGPVKVLMSDLNADGKADLVTVNFTSNTVSVFLGNGDGTFQPKIDYMAGMQPTWAAIADFNGDGKPDIAVCNQNNNTITILLNQGDGTFTAGVAISTSLPFRVVTADLNGDGRVDLIVVSATGYAGVFFGAGDGTFQAPSASIYVCCDSSLAVGDFNGDGKPDLALGMYVYLNNGDGTFGDATYLADGAFAWAVVDLNADGKADLIGTDHANGLMVYLGKGDGTFQTPVYYPAGSGPSDITLADINGEGKLDVVVASSLSNAIFVLPGNGNGTLQPGVSYSVGRNPVSVVAGDFDGDGRTDLAVVNSADNSLSILLGTLSVLNISSTHGASFYPGQIGAAYSIIVTNTGPKPTLGTLTVTDLLPACLTATAISGSGWNCVLSTLTCTRSDALAVSSSYPPITLTVNAASNAPVQVTNIVSVSGGNTVGAAASDPTAILALPSAPILSTPANGATGLSRTPVLSWTSATGATSYNVYFGVTAAPPLAANTTSLQYSPSLLAPGKTYYWQVSAVNLAGSTTSPIFSFTTLGPPQASHAGIFRSGFFWILDVDGNQLFNNPPDLAFAFGGNPGDIPITGDWNGDGRTKVGVYRPHSGLFVLDYDGDGQFTSADKVYNLGVGTDPTDIPVIGDWNGDGRSKIGIYRQGFEWLLDYNGDGAYQGPPVDRAYFFGGIPGDVPVVGDWTGTGTSKIGLVRLGF